MVKISVDSSALEQEKPSELRKYLDLTGSEAFKMQLRLFWRLYDIKNITVLYSWQNMWTYQWYYSTYIDV